MKIRPVFIIPGTLFLLLGVFVLVENMREEADVKRSELAAESAEFSSELRDKLLEAQAEYVDVIIGPSAASCFRATGGKWDPAEMVKHCGMTAEEAKRKSVRYPKSLAQAEADETRRQQKELSKLGKTK